MSLTAVRQFFRDRLEAEGFEEHPDGFNVENIPNVSIDRSYHIENGSSAPRSPIAHLTIDIDTPMTVRLYFKGFRDPSEAIDEALSSGESVLCDILGSAVRLEGTIGIKNVSFVSMLPAPIADSNDNDVILIMQFTARTILEI